MSFDIDIDVAPHTQKTDYGIRAIQINGNDIRLHPSGYYMKNGMCVDPETNAATIEYKDADNRGFIKIDLLTNISYENYNTKQDQRDAIEKEPNWDLFRDEGVVGMLPHIANHYELISRLDIRSIDDLADALALIRPAKASMIDDYLNNKVITRKQLYRKPTTGEYYFKKSHAYAYAIMIVGLLNTIDNTNWYET